MLLTAISEIIFNGVELTTAAPQQIRTTHGLNDFAELQDVKPVIDELRLLQTHWASLTRHEQEFGDMLFKATVLFEEAADPDGWGELRWPSASSSC